MPPRQGHRKSRAGCTRCKARKVKCDEARPVCSGCLRHPQACVYLDASSKRSTTSSTRSTTSTVKSPRHQLPSPPATPYAEDSFDDYDEDRRRTLELLLLHHFIHHTNPTFPGFERPERARKWLSTGIHYALEFDFLLNILMAISALHIVVDPPPWIGFGPGHEFDFARVHRVYLNRATKSHREALNSIDATNAAPLMHASLFFQYASLRLMPDDSEEEEYEPPVHWLSMCSAIKSIALATRPYTQGSESDGLKYFRESAGPDFEDEEDIRDFNYDEPLKSIVTFDDGSEIVDAELFQVYDQTAAYISKTHKSIVEAQESENVVARRVTGFGAMLPRPFIALVAQHKPRALALLAHHSAMKKCMEQYWWLRGTAERDVHGIRHLLPKEWQWAMEWPLQILKSFTGKNYAPHPNGFGNCNPILTPTMG